MNRALALPLSSSSFPLCLPLSPSISPKPMIATTSNRDCDEGRARLSRRKERRRAGREEGSEGGRAAAKGGGRARRGSDIALPFRRQTVFYAARDRAITSSRRRLHRSTRAGPRIHIKFFFPCNDKTNMGLLLAYHRRACLKSICGKNYNFDMMWSCNLNILTHISVEAGRASLRAIGGKHSTKS